MGQSIDELIKTEKYSEFVDSYSIDEGEAATHKARRTQRRSRWEAYLWRVLMIALVAASVYSFIDRPSAMPILLAVIGAFMLLIFIDLGIDASTDYQARKSETTDRDLICYEVEAAIESYREGDYDGVYQHLSDLQAVVRRRRGQELSYRMRGWLRRYLDRVENAKNREDAIEETFDRFVVHFIDDLLGVHNAEIHAIVEDIDVEDVRKEESSNRRALIDVARTVGSIVTSGYGVIVSSFLAAGVVYFISNQLAIAVAIQAAMVTSYQFLEVKRQKNPG